MHHNFFFFSVVVQHGSLSCQHAHLMEMPQIDNGTMRWATMYAIQNYCQCRRQSHCYYCYRSRLRWCFDSVVRPAALWLFLPFSRCRASNRFDFSTTSATMCRTVSPIASFAPNWPPAGHPRLSSPFFGRVSSVAVAPLWSQLWMASLPTQ